MKKMILELKRILTEQSSSVKNTSEWKNALTSHEVFYIECIKTESNLVRALCYSILVFAVQISNIIGDKLTSAHPGFELGYLAGNLFLTLISVIYFFITLFILSEYRQGAKMKLKKTVYLSFWFFISLGSLFFCLLDLMERESLINFIILLTSITIIPILKKKEYLSLLAFSFAGQSIFILFLQKKLFIFQQCIMITIGAAIISKILFNSYVASKIAQKRLKVYAETDTLTGLLNRRGLENWIAGNRQDCLKNHYKIVVGIVDIDDFKEYNDEFGHLEGDECLKNVADCISKSFVKNKGIVSRFGGEEFIIVLKNLMDNEVINGFKKIKYDVENSKKDSWECNISKNVTISIGVACEQVTENSKFSAILERADNALYIAKRNGKNLVVFDNGKCYT